MRPRTTIGEVATMHQGLLYLLLLLALSATYGVERACSSGG